MRCRKECEEKHRQDRHTPPCHVAVPPCHAAQPVHGRARESSPSPPLKSLVPGMCKNILQKSFPSPFLQILSKSNSSVSIILERPTLHPIQTTHLFPVLICKLFRDYLFFFFHLRPLPLFSSQWPKQKARPTSIFQPLETSQGQNLSQFFFLVCICHEQARSFYNADTHTCAFAHGNRFFYLCFFFLSNLWFLFFFFPFCRKCKQKKNKVFN